MSPDKRTARIAGLLYLLVAVTSGFALSVRTSLIAPGNAAATVSRIAASETLFRITLVSDLIGQTFHVLLVLALYKLLKDVDRNQAALMTVLALVPVPIACINLLNQVAVLPLLHGADYLKVFTADQLHAQAMFLLNLQSQGILIAQVFWGLWLFPLGYLVFKSRRIPRILGILLIVAGLGYLVDCLGKFLLPNYTLTVSTYTFIGELSLTFWLLIWGVKDQPRA